MNFLDECRALIGVESTPAQGSRAAAEHVGALCEAQGLCVELVHEVIDGIAECTVLARPTQGRPAAEFMLHSRLTTAPAGHYGQWTKTRANPFNASIYGDVIYGLGAANAKLDILCKLDAARHFIGQPLRLPFVLVGTFGDHGGRGAARVVEQNLVNASAALIGQPTGGRAGTGGPGVITLEIKIPFSDEEVAFRREHDERESTSSQSRLFSSVAANENAIATLFGYLNNLPSGLAILQIDGGSEARGVPTQALLELDTVAGFRDPILPKLTRAYAALDTDARPVSVTTSAADVRLLVERDVAAQVDDHAFKAWQAHFSKRIEDAGATVSVKEHRRGFKTDPDDGFVKAAQDILESLGLNSGLLNQVIASEANVFSHAGIACVAWGPGQTVAPVADECIDVNELRTASEFYRRMIERVCS